MLPMKACLDGVKRACPYIAKDNANRSDGKKNDLFIEPLEGEFSLVIHQYRHLVLDDDIKNLRRLFRGE